MTYLPLVHVCYWSEFAATKLLEFEVFLLLVNKKGAKVSISKGKIIHHSWVIQHLLQNLS